MTRSSDPEWLEDYLDGRLPDEQRAALEKRIRGDAELARRVESALEIRAALRDASGEGLSADFYARARRRFERTPDRVARTGFRIVSWEAAGLATAALLAGMLFLPFLRQQEPGRPPTAQPRVGGQHEARDRPTPKPPPASTSPDQPLRDSMSGRSDLPSEPAKPRALTDTPVAGRTADHDDADTDGAEGYAEPTVGSRSEKRTGLEPARPEPPPASGPALRRRTGERDAPPAPPRIEAKQRPIARQAPVPTGDGKLLEREVARPAEAPPRRAARSAALAQATAEAHSREETAPAAVDLPAGFLEPGSLRTVEERAEWERLLEGPAGGVLSSLGGFYPGRRLVLVGPRESPLDCARATVIVVRERYRVSVPASAGGSRGGCALTLPSDGRPVEAGIDDPTPERER